MPVRPYISLREVADSEVERNVVQAVAWAGALTQSQLCRRFGPLPNWSRLIDRNHLVRTYTVYGPVLSLAPKAYEEFRQYAPEGSALPPYLRGPNAIADRAYQSDALATLKAEGYRLLAHTYKQRGGLRRLAEQGAAGFSAGQLATGSPDRRYDTDQIIFSTLRVSESEARWLEMMWRRPVESLREVDRSQDHHRLGYPRMYATVSGGGINVKRARELLRIHMLDIVEWRSPLLIVVPDLTPFRGLERFLNAQQAALQAENRRAAVADRSFVGHNAVLRLIEQRLPQ